jgi:hypothetical protein
MAINRHVVKRSLAAKTKAFIANNIQAIEEFLAPTVRGFGQEITKLEGPRGRVLELSFREARTAWEKFFWASLGHYWITDDLTLEQAVRHAEDDLMALSNVLTTVIAPERAATEKMPIDPSITCPISLRIGDPEIIREEMDDEITMEPTEEVDLEHPRVMLPPESVRLSGPEEPTVVDRVTARPKV